MRSVPRVAVLLLLFAAVAALTGCRDQAKQISRAPHLLESQNKAWAACLEGCEKGQPDLGKLVFLGNYLCDRTRRRAEEDYPKANKAEVVALLKEMGDEYRQNVMQHIHAEGQALALNRGVTDQYICNAVLALKDRYQKLVEMTKE